MDRRIINTKKKLTNSLLLIIKEKSINDITVLELCQRADINRTTFYKYYKDIDDLVYTIEESLISELEKGIINIQRNYLITYTGQIIEQIAAHKDIYTVLLSENGDHKLLRKILSLVHKQSLEEWEKLLKKASKDDLENINNFIVDGSTGIIENWIKHDCKESPQTIALFINKICMSGLSSFI